jgi:hypothetical protein
MHFPDRKLAMVSSAPPFSIAHLTVDPNRPHKFMPHTWAPPAGMPDNRYCRACGGSERNTLHLILP